MALDTTANDSARSARRALGALWREYRERRGWTQPQVARAMGEGVYDSKISIWETGREIPVEYHAEELIRVLRIPVRKAREAYYLASLERALAIRDAARERRRHRGSGSGSRARSRS